MNKSVFASRSIRFLLQSDRKVQVAAMMLKLGRPLSLVQQTYILNQGIDLAAFERRFAA